MSALPPKTQFDAFVYRYPNTFPPAPALSRAFGSLRSASASNDRRAIEWLRAEEPRGWGAIYDALVLAASEDVDTVVLLSDGVPSRGAFDRPERVVAEFARWNRFRRVAVDTVLVGEARADREFMSSLSAATGGRFRVASLRGS